jgi:hypothetical protein
MGETVPLAEDRKPAGKGKPRRRAHTGAALRRDEIAVLQFLQERV